MRYEIEGTMYPVLTAFLDKDEQVVAQTHAMISKTEGVEMETKMYGGITKGIRRMAGGDSTFLTAFTSTCDNQHVSFADGICGKILPLEIKPGTSYLCDRAAYLCSSKNVDLDVAFMKRIRMGLFGGESFVMERLSGEGIVFLHGWGELQKKTLNLGERLQVATSHIMAVSSSVTLDIEFIRSLNNILFSGQGLFITTVTGPGDVYIQSITEFPKTK